MLYNITAHDAHIFLKPVVHSIGKLAYTWKFTHERIIQLNIFLFNKFQMIYSLKENFLYIQQYTLYSCPDLEKFCYLFWQKKTKFLNFS